MLRPVLYVALALWLVIGGGVFIIALAGGPGSLRSRLHTESRLGNRLRLLGLATVLAFGLAVPIAVGVANGHDKARVGPAGITLTKSEAVGRELFARTCATCHTLAAASAVGHVGPNLDILMPNESLVLFSIKHGFAMGRGQMPANIYTGQDARDVAAFVAAVAGH